MKVETVVVGPIETNCYLVEDAGELMVVDPGAQPQRILKALRGRPVKLIVLTHSHWDHIDGLTALVQESNAPVFAGAKDADDIENPPKSTLLRLHAYGHPHVNRRLVEGDEVALGSAVFKVLETPGHTPGSICLYCAEEGVLLSGDTVFCGGRFGRTDFAKGDPQAMQRSLRKISDIVADGTRIYCGHESSTTMERERRLNPYFR